MESTRSSTEASSRLEEQKAFLDIESNASTEGNIYNRWSSIRALSQARDTSKRISFMFWFHSVVVVVYVVVFFGSWKFLQEKFAHGPNTVWTPARDSIIYDKTRFHIEVGGFSPEFFGKPSEALEDEWEKILKRSANSWFTEDEVARFGGVTGDPVILPDGTYMGATTVYHHLHCIKRLYRSLNKEHYFHDMTEEEEFLLNMHNMHCLDFLRKAAMCQGDTSPIVYKWDDKQPIPIGDMNYEHECVNWESLHDWALSRRVDPFEPGAVIHPKFGPAYANLTAEKNDVGATVGHGPFDHSR